MRQDLHSRVKLWGGLTLAVAVAMSGAIAIANAESGGPQHVRPDKAKTCSSSKACLEETNSESGPGVEGSSSTGDGVQGRSSSLFGVEGDSTGSNAGVGGFNTGTATSSSSTYASGVYGQSTNGPGVYGLTESSSYYAVYGNATAGCGSSGLCPTGVYGESTNGFGVVGDSTNLYGVYAYSENQPGVLAYSANSYAVETIGNVFVSGEIYTEGSCEHGCTRSRGEASFAARTSQPTIDDVGEALLRNGIARITLASDFANAIDASKPYVVLLTPEGDADTLYVTNRTPSGFDVRESHAGHSSIGFAYRIVAKPFGVRDERLPFKTLNEPAPPPKHN